MPVTTRQMADAAAALDPLLRLVAIYDRIPGMAFGIAHGADTALLGAHGVADVRTGAPVDPATTTFRCASITKSFTATVILRLGERGKLRLDDPVVARLPWTRGALSPELTVRHLLMHAGSVIRDGTNAWEGPLMPDRASVTEQVRRGGTFGEPSERFRYSNIAYSLLGEIAERVSGRSFSTLLQREVVGPLGLGSTWADLTRASGRQLATGYWLGHPDEAPEAAERAETRAIAPAGGLVSCVPDLLEYQRAHLPGDDRLLTEYAKREMQRPQWQRATEPHYGLGWMTWHVDGIGVVGHSGGFPGFVTKIGFAPSIEVAAAVLTNAQVATAQRCVDLIYHVIASVESVWARSAQTSRWHTRASLARLAGLYRLHVADAVVARINGSLFLLGPQDLTPFTNASRLEPKSRTRFRIAEGYDFGHLGEDVTFELDRRGNATTMHWGAHVYRKVPF
jgi:CubicO group peptidase (beta-lactamase class C family)